MRKKEIGQVLILVLILLAIGSLLVVPTLRLGSTSSLSSQVVGRQMKGLYACDAAQEYILWKLLYDTTWRNQQLQNDDDSDSFSFDVCGVPVSATVIMRAVAGEGGMTLFGDDVIRPTKTVVPDTIPNDWSGTVTYTINLEQLSEDNSQGLDAIYDILPDVIDSDEYVVGSSYLSIDGGSWVSVPDPLIEVTGGQVRLKWPADYDHETGTGAFSSDPLDVDHYFNGIRDFAVRQEKELKFEVIHTFSGADKNSVQSNWVVLKPWNTLSGAQAPIIVGSPANPEATGGLLLVDKISNPGIIQPGVETDIEYTINITNQAALTIQMLEIRDYLPPEFEYIGFPGGVTTIAPQLSLVNLNGVDRWQVLWTTNEFPGGGAKSIAAGETVTQTFLAKATKDVSGSYYNEITVIPDVPVPTIFSQIGITGEEYYTCYSWNTGAVMVPAYDSSTESEGITIDANMALILGGISIKSWQVH